MEAWFPGGIPSRGRQGQTCTDKGRTVGFLSVDPRSLRNPSRNRRRRNSSRDEYHTGRADRFNRHIISHLAAGAFAMIGQELTSFRDAAADENAISARARTFCIRHNLTMAEASVLNYLVLGMDLPSISKAQGRTLATIKTHVSNIFSKTYTRRQAELVSVFFRM
jgi:DNA-binding CsgD family transcriptional regulator